MREKDAQIILTSIASKNMKMGELITKRDIINDVFVSEIINKELIKLTIEAREEELKILDYIKSKK